MDKVIIRKMQFADLPQVLAIAEDSFKTPWSLSSFAEELKNEFSLSKVAQIQNELSQSKPVAGYIFTRMVHDEAQILDLAVKSSFRRSGLAKKLLSAAINECELLWIKKVFLEVRKSNSPAIQLYSHFAFKTIGRRKGYYENPREDAFVMKKELSYPL